MRCLILLILSLALPVQAATLDTSLRPIARDDGPEAVQSARLPVRPQARPAKRVMPVTTVKAKPPVQTVQTVQTGAAAAPTSDDLAIQIDGVVVAALNVRSLRPTVRPGSLVKKAMARKREAKKGRLCGVRGLQGKAEGNVPGRGACGIKNAVRVTHVSGVRLTTGALMDCTTAKALKSWVDKGMKPAVGNLGGGVESIRVAAHYACRTRNNQPGAKLSEHGRGRAIDISAFNLRNGDTITLLKHWNSGAKGRALKKMHRAACGPFGTVLGPNANRFHKDHFHFDTARYRSGSYCR